MQRFSVSTSSSRVRNPCESLLNTSSHTELDTNASLNFKLKSIGEKLRFRDAWTCNLVRVINDRLHHPRFSFPGVYDRAAPPPKTLHWRHAPQDGEYDKMKAMLSWATLHVWLLSRRLKDTDYNFLISHCYDHLYNELTGVWLPEASIPGFSIKSEAKMLVDECRETESLLSSSESGEVFRTRLWLRSFSHCHLEQSDPIMLDLIGYLCVQKEMLEGMSCPAIVDSSWLWKD